MLYPRIIPCLLVKNQGLVKTVNFKDPKYIGDPINAVKIFNEKEVDELVILDIGASIENREPNYKMIESLAAECRMPLCYGGGVKTVEQVIKIIKLGVEKVALGSSAITKDDLISEASNIVGSQSVVVVLDIKTRFGKYEAFINNGKERVTKPLFELVKDIKDKGAGEIILNSIDNDGVMKGYDIELIEKIRELINIPLTALGGAGSLDDIDKLFSQFQQIGAAAGSMFVYKGKFKAVLINYPTVEQKQLLFKGCYNSKYVRQKSRYGVG